MFKIEIYTEISATLPTPQKDSGSVLKTMWSFNALFTNMRILKCKSQLTIAFLAAVNHLNGPLRNKGRFPFSQNFRNFRFGGKWNTFRRFIPLENSQKKWKI